MRLAVHVRMDAKASGFDKTMTVLRHSPGACALVLAAIFGGGCATSSPSLTVQIDAPEGAKIDVEVTGPGGFKKTINTTTTFENATPGQYKVALVESRKRIARDVIDDVFVGKVDQPEPRVTDSTTVVITFDREPGSGHLWVPIAREDKVVAFSAAAFADKALPTYTLATPAGSGPDAIAFRLGDLWVAFSKSGAVARYDAMSLVRPGDAPAPSKTIGNLGTPSGLAFDKAGDLYVAEASKKAISRFTGVTDKPVLSASWHVDGVPSGMAFDGQNSLFVATSDPPAVRIFTYPATSSTRPILRASIAGTHTGLVAPSGVAFGNDGALWVTNGDRAPAVRFEPSVFADANGDVDAAPSAVLAPATGDGFNGIAFDKEGQGWFAASHPSSNDLRCGVAMQTEAPGMGPALPLGVQTQALGGAMLAFNPPPVPSPIRR